MYERIQVDEVVDDDLFDLFPVDLSSFFVQFNQILHQEESIHFQLVFISDEGVLHHDQPLPGLIFYFYLFSLILSHVVDRTLGQVVQHVGPVDEGRCLRRTLDTDYFSH